jgi:hypothetical protein
MSRADRQALMTKISFNTVANPAFAAITAACAARRA